jgi:Fimbrial protein.
MLGGEEVVNIANAFTDTHCTNSDVVTKLETSEYIIGMGPGDNVRLKVKVEWQSDAAISMRNKNGIIEAPYKVTISETNSLEAVTVSAHGGYSVNIENIAVMSGATNQRSFVDWLLIAAKYLSCNWKRECIAGVLASLNGQGVYKANLTINYNRKETTCAPQNLTITLDPVPIARLRKKGEVSEFSRQGDIILDCKNQVRNAALASRQINVHLRSDLLWDENESVLRPETDNGVGFILRDANRNLLKINRGAALKSQFKSYSKGSVLNSVETIPVFATYYVIDPAKIHAGALQSKALIVVSYN